MTLVYCSSATMTTAARAVFSRACLISTKAVTRSATTASTGATAATSFQRTTSSPHTCSAGGGGRLVTTLMGLLGAGGISVVHPIVVTLCEKKKGNDDDDGILSRDENGNIDWSAVLDKVATITGEKVCHDNRMYGMRTQAVNDATSCAH